MVWGASESIDTANATGRSGPKPLSVGATNVVTETLPPPATVLNVKKSYSLSTCDSKIKFTNDAAGNDLHARSCASSEVLFITASWPGSDCGQSSTIAGKFSPSQSSNRCVS